MKRSVLSILIWVIAAVTISTAEAQTPRNAQDYSSRGFERQKRGDLDGAIEDFTQAIQQSHGPTQASFYENRAQARMLKNDWDGAILDYTQSLEIQVGPIGNEKDKKQSGAAIARPIAMTYNNRGNARKGKGDIEGAIADYNKALETQPRFAEAYYNRGLAFQSQDELEKQWVGSEDRKDIFQSWIFCDRSRLPCIYRLIRVVPKLIQSPHA